MLGSPAHPLISFIPLAYDLTLSEPVFLSIKMHYYPPAGGLCETKGVCGEGVGTEQACKCRVISQRAGD